MSINIIVNIKMEANNRINEGEWLCTIEGLAIAEKVYDLYSEEFDSIPQDKKIGDYNFLWYNIGCFAIMMGILSYGTDAGFSMRHIVARYVQNTKRF